ncbi:ATP synthase gamma chain [Candidatus Paraburkholderia kirkii]|nr:ATP synthase gamma chain [Candidatus Paraburkholderia kirkii]
MPKRRAASIKESAMAGMKEIRGKIKSVQNTRKITKAMEMVAASKMRRAQERMRSARPYADKVRAIASHMSEANPEYRHPFMVKNDGAKTAGLILVTTDKGLCGGMNTNILRVSLNKIKELDQSGLSIEASAIGGKGLGFLNRLKAKVVSQVTQLGDTPHLEKLIGAIKVQLDLYSEGKINAVYLAYTRFINTMKQEAVIEQLLPLSVDDLHAKGEDGETPKTSWDYIYEPDAQTVVDELLVRYVEALVYQAVAENMASEQSARMVAMKAASDNAKQVINELQLVYNKSRQAAITKELSEIVGGAAAV